MSLKPSITLLVFLSIVNLQSPTSQPKKLLILHIDLQKDLNGVYGFRQIEGTLPDGRKALIIWRNINQDNILASNAALDAYFSKYRINPADREFDVIYINGDNNLENLRLDDEQWKVVLIETEFNKRMWEE